MNNSIQTEVSDLNKLANNIWITFLSYVPAIILAIIVFVIGLFIIKKLKAAAESIITPKSSDPLITDFLVNLIAIVLGLMLIVICLSILGWGSITDKILAGAGISTFIIGFALKDIGENFLAGLIMAFRKPFKIGDLIEVESTRGTVMKMSLRETTIKSLDGKDIFIPNALIIKSPLINYTLHNNLRTEFSLTLVNNDQVEKAFDIIDEVLKTYDSILSSPSPNVQIDTITNSKISMRVQFWFKTDEITAPGQRLKSKVMYKVAKELVQQGIPLAD